MRKLLRIPVNILTITALFAALSCTPHPHISSVQSTTIELNRNADDHVDSNIVRTIAPYKNVVDKEMSEVLVQSKKALSKAEPEGELGNLVADIILDRANNKYHPSDNIPIDICVLNNGGLRVSLPQGTISKGNIFELMPFENEMVVVTLSGEKMRTLANFIAAKNGMPVSGLKMGIKDKEATHIMINGIALDPAGTYKVVTSDYLAGGGDKMDFFKDASKTEALNYKLRDALIDYMKEAGKAGKMLDANLEGRVYYDK